MNSTTFDVIIVGAGIVGAACAFECSAAGLSVAVIEDIAIAAGATGAAMGHIVLMDDSEAQFALTNYSQKLWRSLQTELAVDCDYSQTGTLWIAAGDEELRAVYRKHSQFRERGVETEIVDANKLTALEPHLRQGLAGALLVSSDALVSPPRAAAYLLDRAIDRGARTFFDSRVDRLDDDGVVLNNGARLSGSAMINAAGARAAQLTPTLPVVARKGHLVITDARPGFVHHQLVELGYLHSAHQSTGDSVAFNVQPKKSGQILIGSSRQYGATNDKLDAGILSRMLARAAEYMPEIPSFLALRAWTGLRAASPDNLPLIGKVTGYNRVYAATGHEGLGITTSLGTAKLLADELLDRPSAIPRAPYQPERLAHFQPKPTSPLTFPTRIDSLMTARSQSR
jgi:glycine/D-amino acid oxidase-like deaminating enzyme